MSTPPKEPFDVADFAEHFNHHTDTYRQHSHETYKYMRENCPVTHSDEMGGFWIASRYEDIMAVARDDETFCSRYGIIIPASGAQDAPPEMVERPI